MMQQPKVYFVGTEAEVQHHALPLRQLLELQIVAPGEASGLARPGDIAIFFSEHFDRFRECSRQLREQSVATIYAIDGILEWRNAWSHRADEPACPWTMRPALAHKVACIGRHQARILSDWGNRGRVEVIGIPRLDSLAAAMPLEHKRPARLNATFRLLVMTAKFPGFTAEQTALTFQSLQDVRDWLRENPTVSGEPIEVTWRLTQGLAEQLGVPNTLSETSGSELADLLRNVDAVITTPSTAMLEAMLCDLPVATLDYHNVPSYVQPAWTIGRAEAIGPNISQLHSPTADRLHFQQTTLRDELECTGSASERMATLIREMQRHATECLQDQRPLSFPAQIVPLESLDALKFPAGDLYPEHAAFGEADPDRLQAELAHARREIMVLQANIEQLRSELAQAHAIFDQIHSHPIAGPVVRLRQKLIDAMGQLSARKAKLESLEKS